jgi:Ca-activated chloride channel family protein
MFFSDNTRVSILIFFPEFNIRLYDKKSIVKILSHINVGIAGQQTALYEALFLSSKLFKDSHSKETPKFS